MYTSGVLLVSRTWHVTWGPMKARSKTFNGGNKPSAICPILFLTVSNRYVAKCANFISMCCMLWLGHLSQYTFECRYKWCTVCLMFYHLEVLEVFIKTYITINVSIILSTIKHLAIANFDNQLEMKMPGFQMHRFDNHLNSHQLHLIAKKA